MYKSLLDLSREYKIQDMLDKHSVNHVDKFVPLKEKFYYPCYSKFIKEKNYTGFFCKVPLKKGAIISIEGGNLIPKEVVPELNGALLSMVFDEDTYLYPSTIENMSPSWFTNHSCNPNLDIIGRLITVANRDIDAHTELTVDYAIALPDYEFNMECLCQSENCRKKVTGEDWRIPELARDLFIQWPAYIQKKIIEENILNDK